MLAVIMCPSGKPSIQEDDLKSFFQEEENHACGRCGTKWKWSTFGDNGPRKSDYVIEHIDPRTKGGDDSVENLRPICTDCNNNKPRVKKITLRLDWNKWEKFDSLAKKNNQSTSDLLREAIDSRIQADFSYIDESGNTHLVEIKTKVDKILKSIEADDYDES